MARRLVTGPWPRYVPDNYAPLLLRTSPAVVLPRIRRACEFCHEVSDAITRAPSMTAYPGRQPQPWACATCVQEWIDYWTEQWRDYYAMIR